MTRKVKIIVAFICPDCDTPSEVKEIPVRDNGKPFPLYEFPCQKCGTEKHTRYEDIQIRLLSDRS